jgi:predicted porin
MKKTIIASAIAAVVAAPAAFADIKISGQINQEFTSGYDHDTTTAAASQTTSTRNNDTLGSGNNADIVFSGSEDLGNGMTASFKIHHYFDDSTVGTAADQTIGLAGDFGSVTVGRFEPYTVSSITSMMNIDASEDLDLETSFGQGRTEGGIKYVSPNMNGLTVGFEGFADETDTGDNFATTTVFAQYSNAGLTVKVAQEDDSTTANTYGDIQVTSIGVAYKMGDLELRVVNTDDDNGTAADVANTFYGAKYTMGANTIAVGMNDHDTANSDDKIISLSHALSKSTSVYLVHEQIDASGADDNTLVGVKHTF